MAVLLSGKIYDMSWQILAVISALAAGATSVLAKVGLENVPSNLANAVGTAMVLVLSIGVVLFSPADGRSPRGPSSTGARVAVPDACRVSAALGVVEHGPRFKALQLW